MIDTALTHRLWLTVYLLLFGAVVARADVRPELIKTDEVAIVERNIHYEIVEGENKLELRRVIDQLIFRDQYGDEPGIVAWRMTPKNTLYRQRDHRGPYLLFYDRGELRRVRYRVWDETHTSYDNERWEQEFRRADRRRELR